MGHDDRALSRVEVCDRLVHQDQVGTVHDILGNGQAALLSIGQLLGLGVFQSVQVSDQHTQCSTEMILLHDLLVCTEYTRKNITQHNTAQHNTTQHNTAQHI